jgi:hypothetical protein
VAPTITARTPAPAARSVSQTGNLTATFSEAVANVGNSTFAVRLGTNNTTATPLAAAVTYNSATRTATLNPSATLLPDRTYTAAISNIRDAAGNSVAPTTWTFTTGPAPTLTSIFRGAGATGQARNGNLTAFFSENITGYNSTTVRLTRVSNGAVFPATMIFNPNNRGLTINPSGTLLANTQYRVTVTGGTSAVRDLAGNPFVTRSWTFTTGAGL